ncbi:hypothetical protein HN873_040067 [Arachis hypogaea]
MLSIRIEYIVGYIYPGYRELQGLNKQETADRYEKEQIEPQLLSEKNVMIAAHGNSLRSIILYVDNLTSQEIVFALIGAFA